MEFIIGVILANGKAVRELVAVAVIAVVAAMGGVEADPSVFVRAVRQTTVGVDKPVEIVVVDCDGERRADVSTVVAVTDFVYATPESSRRPLVYRLGLSVCSFLTGWNVSHGFSVLVV